MSLPWSETRCSISKNTPSMILHLDTIRNDIAREVLAKSDKYRQLSWTVSSYKFIDNRLGLHSFLLTHQHCGLYSWLAQPWQTLGTRACGALHCGNSSCWADSINPASSTSNVPRLLLFWMPLLAAKACCTRHYFAPCVLLVIILYSAYQDWKWCISQVFSRALLFNVMEKFFCKTAVYWSGFYLPQSF